MGKLRTISKEECQLIEEHNNNLLDSAVQNVVKYRIQYQRTKNEHIMAHLAYWRHVVGALKWSNAIARQRTAKGSNVERTAV